MTKKIKVKELLINARDLVKIKKNDCFCDSRQIAERFGKNHDNVLKSIRKLISSLAEIRKNSPSNLMDSESQFSNKFVKRTRSYQGQNFPYYEMNRPAFSLLAMRFTGKKALVWQNQFNFAFYLMEQKLIHQKDPGRIEARVDGKISRKGETDVLKILGNYWESQGSVNRKKVYMTYTMMTYNALFYFEGEYKNLRDDMTKDQLKHLAFAEDILKKSLLNDMSENIPYTEIFIIAQKKMRGLAEIMGKTNVVRHGVKQLSLF